MALGTAQEIEALADGFTAAAGALHRRILKGIKAGSLDQAAAQSLFRQESSLRQKADALYADAVGAIVSGLELDQGELMALVQSAEARIQSIQELRKGMEVFGDLILLAASITAGKPGPILAAVKELRKDLA